MNTETTLAPADTAQNLKRNLQTLAAVLSGPIEPAQVVGLFSQLKQLQDVISGMHDLTRDRLLAHVKEVGTKVTENGTLQARLGDYNIEATIRNTGYDPKKVQSLLRGAQLDVTAGCDVEMKYIPNPDKLEALVEAGKLSTNDLQACRFDPQYNLKRPVRVTEE